MENIVVPDALSRRIWHSEEREGGKNMPLFGRITESLRQYILRKHREKNPPEYIIQKPGDFLHVPEHRLHDCMEELILAINMVRHSGANGKVDIPHLVWIDDGKQEVHNHLHLAG
jgi:hypothetical protein